MVARRPLPRRMTASVQALPGLPAVRLRWLPAARRDVMTRRLFRRLPGLPPFDCDGCPPPAARV